MPYEAIDTIDFTIGDPEVTVVTIGNNSHKWADVHKIVGGKDFWNKIGAATGAQREDHIQCVSMIAYADCLTDEAKEAINEANWIIKARGQKGGRNVVEIKYDIGSVFANVGSTFNTVRHLDAQDVLYARHESEGIFAAEGKWVPKADTNDGTALRVFRETKRQYAKMPFDAFLKIVKQKAGNISKIDLTKFDDKGAKVSFNEFLEHPKWTFTVPINRLWELKGAEKMIWIKILETKQNAVTFIVFPQLKLERPGGASATEERSGGTIHYKRGQSIAICWAVLHGIYETVGTGDKREKARYRCAE